MSLGTIWLDTGMPGLCGFQTGGQAGGVVFTQEEPWISDSFPRAGKAGQSEALFAALRLPSWLSPFPRTKVSPEALDWSTPGTRLALGKRPAKWVMLSPPLSQHD